MSKSIIIKNVNLYVGKSGDVIIPVGAKHKKSVNFETSHNPRMVIFHK